MLSAGQADLSIVRAVDPCTSLASPILCTSSLLPVIYEKEPPTWGGSTQLMKAVFSLQPAISQAEMAPLAEELATEEITQSAGNRLEHRQVSLDIQFRTAHILPQIGLGGKME
jgi:hypothetical protein